MASPSSALRPGPGSVTRPPSPSGRGGSGSRSKKKARREGRTLLFLEETGHWTSPLGLEGLLTNPGTSGGKDGGEANPTELHAGVQGAGGEAAAGRRQGAVGGGDGAWHWHRAAQPVAHRAPGGRLGRGTGRPQGGAGGNAATEARGEAARR